MRWSLIPWLMCLLVLFVTVPLLGRAQEVAVTSPEQEEIFTEPEPMDWRICAGATLGVIVAAVVIILGCGAKHDHRGDGWGMYK